MASEVIDANRFCNEFIPIYPEKVHQTFKECYQRCHSPELPQQLSSTIIKIP
jgi:hypothetical protein